MKYDRDRKFMDESTETLCISCRKACRQRCNWTRENKPVDGWVAEYSKTKDSYCVISCPEFEPGRGLPRELDTEGCLRLLERAAELMREDYVYGRGLRTLTNDEKQKQKIAKRNRKTTVRTPAEIRAENRKDIERFIRSKAGGDLLDLSEPEEVIGMLRKLARRWEQELAEAMMINK